MPEGRYVRELWLRSKAERWNCLKSNEMRWEIKIFERGEIGEDIRREGREMVGMKT